MMTKSSLGGQARLLVKKNAALSQGGQGARKSINLTQAFQNEKAMAQNYREKNERNVLKCKFLYQKLAALGNIEGVPEMIGTQVSQTDKKIKQLQQVIAFKKSQQMKKLRNKVSRFLVQINFQVADQDLQKIEDQIEIILFLMDIFQQKFSQMTSQRKEIDEIISRLQKDNENSADELKKQNSALSQKVKSLQEALQKVRQEFVAHDSSRQRASSLVRGAYRDNGEQDSNAAKDLQIQRYQKRIADLQIDLNSLSRKYKSLQSDYQRARKQQNKWRDRYSVMQSQKDQRIRVLTQLTKVKK